MQGMRGRRWSAAQDEQILDGLERGRTNEQLATSLGSTIGAFKARKHRLLRNRLDENPPKCVLIKINHKVIRHLRRHHPDREVRI